MLVSLRRGGMLFRMLEKDAQDANVKLIVLSVACLHYRYHATALLALARLHEMALNYQSDWELSRQSSKPVQAHVCPGIHLVNKDHANAR